MDNQNYQGPQNNGGNGNNNGNGGNDQKGPQKRQSFMLLLVAALITLLSMSFLMNSVSNSSSKEITYDEFLQMVEDGKVDSVLIKSDKLVITPKQDKAQEKTESSRNPFALYGGYDSQPEVKYYTGLVNDDSLPAFLNKYDVTYSKEMDLIDPADLCPADRDSLGTAQLPVPQDVGRRNDGRCRQIKCKGIRPERNGRYI